MLPAVVKAEQGKSAPVYDVDSDDAAVLVICMIAAYLSSSRSRKYAHIVTFGIEPRKVLGSAEIACALTQQLPLCQAVELAEAVIEPSA